MFSLIWRGTPTSTIGNLAWVDEFGGESAKLWMQFAGITTGEPPGVPKVEGSTLDTYCWTHGGDDVSPAGVMAPTVDVYNRGLFDGTGWPNPTGSLRLTNFRIEEDALAP